MHVEVRQADLLTFEGDGMLIPTNSAGLMTEGVAARAKTLAGQEIEDQVAAHSPIAVGAATATEAGPMHVRRLIHAPLLEAPGARVGVENIRRATRAALLTATHLELEQIAIPGMGYGETGVSHEEAARAIIDEVVGYKAPFPNAVVLMDEDPAMYAALKAQAESR